MTDDHSMKRWPIWPLIALTFALVLLPASSQVIRPEVARWHLAIAHDSLVDTAYHRTRDRSLRPKKQSSERQNGVAKRRNTIPSGPGCTAKKGTIGKLATT
jgi:hypothetical protein